MAGYSTQASILIRKENYLKVLGVRLLIQIGINICLDLIIKRFLPEQ
jgi:hypothetical protein